VQGAGEEEDHIPHYARPFLLVVGAPIRNVRRRACQYPLAMEAVHFSQRAGRLRLSLTETRPGWHIIRMSPWV